MLYDCYILFVLSKTLCNNRVGGNAVKQMWAFVQVFVGFYLFISGFFLTRYELSSRNSCKKVPAGYTAEKNLRVNQKQSKDCWYPLRYEKVILVIVDALRYDFVDRGEMEMNENFHLHLPVVKDLVDGEHGLLFKFIADAPTMTMQRLKGITTGGLPTFMDIKDNMKSNKIVEDNIVHQLVQEEKHIVFMGDSTWDDLYGNYFKRNYSYDSFIVKDLHTVDNGVIEHIFPEMKNTDWTALIAHFLGVDHVGHTFGPDDPHMALKLDQINKVLENIVDKLDDDTLLVVLGDHGMSKEGNHGGATDDETNAALFMYSKKPLVRKNGHSFSNKAVQQVDLVPTLSLLLGLPIPFGNLGSVIPQIFQLDVHSNDPAQDVHALNRALELNAFQMHDYFEAYSSFGSVDTSTLDQMYAQAKRTMLSIQDHQHGNIALQKEYTTILQKYLKEGLAVGRNLWTRFDLPRMATGIVILVLALMVFSIQLIRLHSNYDGAMIGFGVGCVIAPFLFSWTDIYHRWVTLTVLGSQLGYLCQNCMLSMRVKFSLFNIGTCFIGLLHVLGLFSNSYINAEHNVVLFLMSSSATLLSIFHANSVESQNVFRALMYMVLGWFATMSSSVNIIHTRVSIFETILPSCLTAGFILYKLYQKQTFVWFTCLSCYAATWMYWTVSHDHYIIRILMPRYVYLGMLVVPIMGHVQEYDVMTLSWLNGLSIVLGPQSVLVLVCFTTQLFLLLKLLPSRAPAIVKGTHWYLLLLHGFFTTGHHTSFTNLQNAAGFVGFDLFYKQLAGALLLFNTYGTIIIGTLFIAISSNHHSALFGTKFVFTINAVASTMFVCAQRRHLMVWAIFAPKLLYDVVALLVHMTFSILGQFLHQRKQPRQLALEK